MLNNQTPKQVEKALNRLFKKHDIENKITVEKVKKWIWNATGPAMEASNKYNKKCLQLFPEFDNIDELNEILQIFAAAWNTFPHKELDGKSPKQLMKEKMKKMPENEQKQGGMPKIRVGDYEMEFDEFKEMLKAMKKAQKPFKKWIEKNVLPKYKKYLEQMVKSTRTHENYYDVADIFFQRVLHVGFVDIEGIRPEFIRDEFPHWWPTHVIQSNLTPAQVKKSLDRLFEFIELVYGEIEYQPK